MFRKLVSVSGFTLLSRLTGFVRDMVLAWTLGSGILSDAFFVAFIFPNNFRTIFGEGTINPAFLPRYAALRAKGEDKAAAKFADDIFAWQMAAQIVLLVLATIFMPQIISVLAWGWNDDPVRFDLTVKLARITFPYLILTLVAVQLSAMLNAIEKFWAAAAWSNFQNLAMIATLLAWRWFPNAAYAAAWGVLLGGVAQLIFILWAGAREGLWLRLSLPRWSPQIAEFFKAFGAVTVGASAVVISPFIDTMLASLLPTGSRTALYYADRINQLPLGVLGVALGTVLLPEMAARLAKGDTPGSHAAQNRAAAMTLILTLPFMVSFLGLPAQALIRIVASTFYARHDTATPVRATLTAMACNIGLKFVFVWGFGLGIAGIALGTAVGAWINVGLLTWLGRSGDLLSIERQFLRALPAALLAALVTGVGAWTGAHLLQAHGDIVALAAAIVCAGLGYGAVLLLFRGRLPLGRTA
jgi:putative peptidoglycan lipid II flippase